MIDAFVTRAQGVFVKHMSLKPDFRFESRADPQCAAPQHAPVYQHFELNAFQIEMNPEKLASRKRVSQWFEGDDAA